MTGKEQGKTVSFSGNVESKTSAGKPEKVNPKMINQVPVPEHVARKMRSARGDKRAGKGKK